MHPDPLPFERRLGAHPLPDGRAEFRVWAPHPDEVRLRVDGREHAMEDAGFGVYEAVVDAAPGADYAFVLDGAALPDPASRWQPEGLRGPSRLLDAGAFEWTDGEWVPPAVGDLVLYELHVGTFTAEGTFEAVIPHLRELRELGITAIELMPVGEFPGRHGWGYDGVYLSAAQSSYGGPLGLQKLVDAAHREGLAVLLDVVYNHVGASGTPALTAYGPYFTSHYETPWGDAINFDDAHSGAVREWVLQSAEQWVRDFHLDGLRLDAIHAIKDGSPEHLVAAIARRTEPAFVIAESGLNDPQVMRDVMRGGWGCDAAWADDFHHALRVLLTGDREGYYAEFGAVADLAKAFHRPHVHDGTYSTFRHRRFGAKADDVPPERFVVFSRQPRPGRQPGVRRAAAGRGPPAGGVLHAAVAVHADALPGRGARRRRAVPVLLRPHRRVDRRGHARGAPARVRRLRRVPRPRGARSAGPGDLRGVQAHAHRRARRPARPLRRAPARPRRPAAGGHRQRRARRARRLAARAPRPVPARRQLLDA